MAPSACHLCQKECIGARNQYFLSRTEEESELFLRREVYLAIKRRADKEWVGRYYLKYGRNNNFLKPSMSRIGKRQIEIPDKTTVTVVDDRVWVKGPLGEIERKYKINIIKKKKCGRGEKKKRGGKKRVTRLFFLWDIPILYP